MQCGVQLARRSWIDGRVGAVCLEPDLDAQVLHDRQAKVAVFHQQADDKLHPAVLWHLVTNVRWQGLKHNRPKHEERRDER